MIPPSWWCPCNSRSTSSARSLKATTQRPEPLPLPSSLRDVCPLSFSSAPSNRIKIEVWEEWEMLHSLKLTWPLKMGLPKWKVVFQPSIFRCELLVSGRVPEIPEKYPRFGWKKQGESMSSNTAFTFGGVWKSEKNDWLCVVYYLLDIGCALLAQTSIGTLHWFLPGKFSLEALRTQGPSA